MRWRFKRQDFIDGIPGAAVRRFCKDHSNAWYCVEAAWSDCHRLYERYLLRTAVQSQLAPLRTWLYQINGGRPVAQRCRVRWAGYAEAFRNVTGQFHFWQNFDSVVMSPRLYEYCHSRLVSWRRSVWFTQRIIRQMWP